MAVWTASDLSDRVLEQLGIKAAGQSASAEDTKTVTDAWTSIHDQLSKVGLVLFASTAIDEWAQEPLVKYIAGKLAARFGHTGARFQALKFEGDEGEKELQQQSAGPKHNIPANRDFF